MQGVLYLIPVLIMSRQIMYTPDYTKKANAVSVIVSLLSFIPGCTQLKGSNEELPLHVSIIVFDARLTTKFLFGAFHQNVHSNS